MVKVCEVRKKDQSPCNHGFPSFSQNAPCHSREGGNPLGITVIHTGVLFLNQPNLPYLGSFFQAHLNILGEEVNLKQTDFFTSPDISSAR